MLQEVIMKKFIIRPYQNKDIKSILSIYNQSRGTPMSLEQFKALDLNAKHFGYFRRYVLEENNSILAYGHLMKRPGSREGYLITTIQVDQSHRNKGYGKAIWDRLWSLIQREKPNGLETFILDTEPISKEWAERIGFKMQAHEVESILRLKDYRPRYSLSKVPIMLDGLQYGNLANEESLDKWERACRLYLQLCQENPQFIRIDHLAIDVAKYILSPNRGVSEDSIWIAKDQEKWIGMTVLRRVHKKEMRNAFTAVCTEYQGKGIGSILKYIASDFAYERKIAYLRTFNLSANEAMLAINQRMGYKKQSGQWLMEWNLAELY
ncbi:hypothetical protein DL897_15265 [Thermoflavimicrobium daqui]|uniref:N-acetyltransferase domain-containing protein n=2 Tax=Thermoflavimicrobium daqui TaxID=2137476 RepID=A0A364K1Q3_9BACL|nr:hypothetical protein DL897_15265 [Thermoflavimicrobium daqui]